MASGREPVQTPVTPLPRRAAEVPVREPKAMIPSSRPSVAGAEMPYFREYLRDVLRPRVEFLVQSLSARLNDLAWRELLEAVARDQGGPAAPDSGALRALLEDQLGLRLEAQVRGAFAGVTPGDVRGAPSGPDHADEAEAAKRRAVTSNPLANAVLDNRATRF